MKKLPLHLLPTLQPNHPVSSTLRYHTNHFGPTEALEPLMPPRRVLFHQVFHSLEFCPYSLSLSSSPPWTDVQEQICVANTIRFRMPWFLTPKAFLLIKHRSLTTWSSGEVYWEFLPFFMGLRSLKSRWTPLGMNLRKVGNPVGSRSASVYMHCKPTVCQTFNQTLYVIVSFVFPSSELRASES